ncbi:hypothetical protein RHDC4_03067 [Rhodocyclaceae bacterium]|nr:hypothetical protein RHDC4_03067 [Rhodocyclaceae bacterium]
MFQRFLAEKLEKYLGIGVVRQWNPSAKQAFCQFFVAIDFAIEDECISSSRIKAGLLAAARVNNGKASVP